MLIPTSFTDDPSVGSKEDNACNPGGAMAGKCDSPWHWLCGYYLARWESAGGWDGSLTIPDWCSPATLLPPKPVTLAESIGLIPFAVTCSDTGDTFATTPGDQFAVIYPANCTLASVWGTGIYTGDSGICTAAIHAGTIPIGGGVVIVTMKPGQASYTGSTANGITTNPYGVWSLSMILQ